MAADNRRGVLNLFRSTYRPFEDDARLVDGFIVGDVGAVNGAFVGSPTHHRVRL